MQWFAGFPSKSIHTFKKIATTFMSQFATNRVKKIKVTNLFDIKQAKGESLKKIPCLVYDLDQKFFVKAFHKELRRLGKDGLSIGIQIVGRGQFSVPTIDHELEMLSPSKAGWGRLLLPSSWTHLERNGVSFIMHMDISRGLWDVAVGMQGELKPLHSNKGGDNNGQKCAKRQQTPSVRPSPPTEGGRASMGNQYRSRSPNKGHKRRSQSKGKLKDTPTLGNHSQYCQRRNDNPDDGEGARGLGELD
ncbi:hypothetical protein CR513_48119, partial [Mucuna pruriens]